MDELLIPKDRVPPEILSFLQKIGQSIRSESDLSTLPSSVASSSSSSSNIKDDECDDLSVSPAHRRHVVHVLGPDITSPDKMTKARENDVISLFGNSRPSLTKENPDTVLDSSRLQRGSDVVSVFESRSPPRSEAGGQNCRQSQHLSHHHHVPTTQSYLVPSCSGSSQQYLTPSYESSSVDHPAYYQTTGLRSSPNHQGLSPYQTSGEEGEEERRALNNRSPCQTPKRAEDHTRHAQQQAPCTLLSRSQSPSASNSSSTLPFQTSCASSSRSPPSQQFVSNDDDVLRGLPPRAVTPTSTDVAQKSPKVLTPPETPENDVKRVVPEVFTFDDLTCTQERFRQTWERLNKLHDQFTPTKISPSTPRHPPSTPTSSLRYQELHRSPSLRRISPVDQHLMHWRETASPHSKLKTPDAVLNSLAGTVQHTPKRQPAEEYLSQERDSLSPKPKKRLSFDEEGVPPHAMQTKRARTFETAAAAPCPVMPSTRSSGSGSENGFTFQGYPAQDGQQFGRLGPSTPGKTPLAVAEFQKRMASLAAYSEDDADGDERAGFVFSGTRHVYESMEFQNRIAVQSGRHTPKRKRSEFVDERSDIMSMCTCAVMECHFLQMAECAFMRIRRMDTTPEDFDRFRNELAQTNDILRESMGLMRHIRDICDHRKRPRW